MKEYESSISKVFLSLTCLFILFACGNGEKYEETASPAAPSYECLNCHGNTAPTDSLAKITDDIIDTHYDNWRIEDGVFVTDPTNLIEGYLFESPLSWAANGLGYFVRTNTASDCAHSCHDYHTKDNKINRQWKRSETGHGSTTSQAFTRNWSDSNGVCMRCHSGAGYAGYVDSSNTIYPAWSQPTSGVYGNLITCNSCHDGQGYPSSSGLRLRKAGTVTLTSGSGSTEVNDATVDAGNSATCITCHQFRESGGSLYKRIDEELANGGQTGVNPYDYSVQIDSSFTFINPHYLGAGAILYGVKGFEFQSKRYTPGNPFHQTQGCTGCHMYVSEDEDLGGHTFLVKDHNTNKENTLVCEQCHGPVESFESIGTLKDMDCDGSLEHIKDEIDGLKTRLTNELASRNIYYDPDHHPYFYNDPADRSNSARNSSWTSGELEAAFNLHFIDHDPGSYAHNYRYASQLLWDSYEALTGTSLSCTRPSTGDDRPATEYN